MSEIKITYEVLVDLFRNEKKTSEIQKLDPDFYDLVLDYLSSKYQEYQESRKESGIFGGEDAKRLETQIANIKRLLTNIYELRSQKIISMAQNAARANTKIDTSNLLSSELSFYYHLVSLFKSFRKGILSNVLSLKRIEVPKELDAVEEVEKKKKTKVKVIFLASIPQILAEDGKKYGPFEKDEIGFIPPKLASILISKKRCKEL